jgi:probable F420-dependent oxidoreductase
VSLPVDVQLMAPPTEVVDRARALAATGVAGLFTFEGPNDVFIPLVLAAGVAPVDLMTNVAIAFPRSPVHLAHAAWDLHALSGGRFRLGLGSQVRAHVERRYGATWSHPAARMREVVLAVKAVLAAWEGEAPLDFRGRFTTHTLMTPAFDPGPNPFGPPPVLLGALGPRMTEVAAEVADGLLVMPFNSRRHLCERTVPAIDRGLAAAGRGREELEVIGEVIVATGRTEEEQQAAVDGVRWLLAFYASTPAYRPVLEVEGWADLQPELNAMSKRGEWTAMAGRIDDDMVGTIAVRGTPEECAAQIAARFEGVADRVCCYFPGYDAPLDQISALAAGLRAGGL